MLLKTDFDGFSRDTTSKAIINTNVEHIQKFKQQREERLKMQALAEQQHQLVSEVDDIKRDLSEIKALLQEIGKRL